MLPSVTTLPLSTHPFPYTYLIHDLSSLFCLKCTLYSVHPSIYLQLLFAYNGPTNQNNKLWLGGSKLHSKLWFLICIIFIVILYLYYNITYSIQYREPRSCSYNITLKVQYREPRSYSCNITYTIQYREPRSYSYNITYTIQYREPRTYFYNTSYTI